jgi:hypothetical protein
MKTKLLVALTAALLSAGAFAQVIPCIIDPLLCLVPPILAAKQEKAIAAQEQVLQDRKALVAAQQVNSPSALTAAKAKLQADYVTFRQDRDALKADIQQSHKEPAQLHTADGVSN